MYMCERVHVCVQRLKCQFRFDTLFECVKRRFLYQTNIAVGNLKCKIHNSVRKFKNSDKKKEEIFNVPPVVMWFAI